MTALRAIIRRVPLIRERTKNPVIVYRVAGPDGRLFAGADWGGIDKARDDNPPAPPPIFNWAHHYAWPTDCYDLRRPS